MLLCLFTSLLFATHRELSVPFFYHLCCLVLLTPVFFTFLPGLSFPTPHIRIQSAVFLRFARQHTLGFHSLLLLAFFLLSGDIQLNPGPETSPSVLSTSAPFFILYSAALSDLIDSQ